MMLTYILLTIWAAWAVSCWLSPLVFLVGAEETSTDLIVNPARSLARLMKIRVYVVPELHGGHGYALSGMVTHRFIVVSKAFLNFAPPTAAQFILAHEVAHHELHHPLLRLVANATLVSFLPPVRKFLQQTEHDANDFAESLTGMPRSVVWGINVNHEEKPCSESNPP